MLITVTMATGREIELDGSGWSADGEVVTILDGDRPLASFRNWQAVEAKGQMREALNFTQRGKKAS